MQALIILCKETAPSGAGTTGFVQLVHVATCYIVHGHNLKKSSHINFFCIWSFCIWHLNAFIVVQLMQSRVKEFHLSTVRLLNAYFLCF